MTCNFTSPLLGSRNPNCRNAPPHFFAFHDFGTSDVECSAPCHWECRKPNSPNANKYSIVIDEGIHDEDLRNFTVISDPRSPEMTSDLENSIPKSVVRLEKFYDLHDKFRKSVNCKTNSSSLTHEKVNLGTKDNPQCINLGTGCSDQKKSAFIKLFKNLRISLLGHMMI